MEERLYKDHLRVYLNHSTFCSINAIQCDTSREFHVTIDKYTIPSDAVIRIYVKKPSGKEVYDKCFVENNVIIVQPSLQMLAELGENKAQIQITRDKSVVTSFVFIINVHENITLDSAIESSNEYLILDELIIEARNSISSINTKMNEIEESEIARIQSESQRIQNEESRQNAELLREQNMANVINECNSATSNAYTATQNCNDKITEATMVIETCKNATGNCNDATENANNAAQEARNAAENITDTKVSITDTNPTTETDYYIPFSKYSSSSGTGLLANDGFKMKSLEGTTSSEGYDRLCLGNAIGTGTAKNKSGSLLMYGATAYGTTFKSYNVTSNCHRYLVGASSASAIGSPTQPVYITSDGTIAACYPNFDNYLPLSGGTMTGTINLANSTTYYVDSSANAKFATVESVGEIIGSGALSVGRKADSTVGELSTTSGLNNTASSYCAIAIGDSNAASNSSAVALGYSNTASGSQAVALGYSNTASGSYSFAAGNTNTAYGTGAISLGYHAGNSSYSNYGGLCAGYYVYPSYSATSTTYAGRTILGRYNSTCASTDMLVVGAGTSSTKKNVFRVTSAGKVYGLSAFNSSGADYAEWLREWYDGNPDNEDRVGYFVTIGEDDKLHFANEGDYICGITSGNPSIIGNSDEDYYWKWERDEFNRIKYKEIPLEYDELDEDGNPVIDKEAGLPKKYYSETETTLTEVVSEGYDESLALSYVPRKDRPEWDCVGMMGVLPVRDDGTCIKGQYCKCGQGGIATLATERGFDTYMVIDRISNNVVSVLLK